MSSTLLYLYGKSINFSSINLTFQSEICYDAKRSIHKKGAREIKDLKIGELDFKSQVTR